MQKFKIEELKAHPRNNEFFDDISGENWDAFLNSVKSSGVIEPIVITGDKVIISGHQRVRACEELGINEIWAKVKPYKMGIDNDIILKELIETNLRQRGIGNTNQRKMGLCIKELEKFYGIRQGSAGKCEKNIEQHNVAPKTENELLRSLGIKLDRNTIMRYKKLTEAIPELDKLINDGIVSQTTALSIMAKLSDEKQVELIESLPVSKKLTQKEVEGYIEKLKEKDNQIAGYEKKMEKAEELKQRIRELETQLESQTEPIVKEVIPCDYDKLKNDSKNLKSEIQILNKDNQKKTNELNELRAKLDLIEKESIQYKVGEELQNDCFFAVNKINRFIKETGGLAYLASEIDKLDDDNKSSFTKAVQSLVAWGTNILNSINR